MKTLCIVELTMSEAQLMTSSFNFFFHQCFTILRANITTNRQTWQVSTAQVLDQSFTVHFVQRLHANSRLRHCHLRLCVFEVVVWRGRAENTRRYDLVLDDVAEPRLLAPLFRDFCENCETCLNKNIKL